MVSLVRKTCQYVNIGAAEMKNLAEVKRLTVIALTLSVVFGLGWGLGLAATSSDIEELTFTLQLLFSIFVGSQGILIFIIYGLRSQEVHSVWKTLCCVACNHLNKNYNHSRPTSKIVTAGKSSVLTSKEDSHLYSQSTNISILSPQCEETHPSMKKEVHVKANYDSDLKEDRQKLLIDRMKEEQEEDDIEKTVIDEVEEKGEEVEPMEYTGKENTTLEATLVEVETERGTAN